MSVALAVILGALAVGFTLSPLLRREEEPLPEREEEHGARELESRREVAYENIRDLDAEFAMGKMTERDYQEIRETLLRSAAAVSREMEAAGRDAALDHWVESEVRTRRGTGAAKAACPGCGTANPATSRFCDSCGKPLTAACRSCGAGLRAGARFCGACGSAQ